jgi:hypothetical protein
MHRNDAVGIGDVDGILSDQVPAAAPQPAELHRFQTKLPGYRHTLTTDLESCRSSRPGRCRRHFSYGRCSRFEPSFTDFLHFMEGSLSSSFGFNANHSGVAPDEAAVFLHPRCK